MRFYQKQNNVTGIAYGRQNHYGNLLDGHHKASAANLEGRGIQCLYIEEGIWSSYSGGLGFIGQYDENTFKELEATIAGFSLKPYRRLEFWNESIEDTEIPEEFRMTYYSYQGKIVENWTFQQNCFDHFLWSDELIEGAKKYPTMDDIRRIRCEKRQRGLERK